MFEHFVEELLAVWTYLTLEPEERRQLLGEEEPEEDEKKRNSSDQNQE